ncbi:MAG: hypothetical protein PHU43_10380 [Candidatus Bipolaricaulis sp.]|nr:hypothetical protein [Candidatus Bipolaricaulis sp.]MDD5265222.1 hypothetical protein [Candidatus Bipolaricaulis sp.]
MSAWEWVQSLLVCFGAVTASALSPEAALGQQTVSVVVPRGVAVTLDGSLGPEEWEDATSVPMSDVATLSFKYADNSLWLGIRAREMGVGNLFVLNQGRVRILHSSAALGTAEYTPHGDIWRLTQDFVWRCRAVGGSEAAVAERRSFLESDGWLASTAYMGNPGDLEYQVLWDGEPLCLAVLWLPVSNPGTATSWPAAILQDAIPGRIPAIAHFTPSQWATVVLEPPPLALSSPRSGEEIRDLATSKAQQANGHLRQCRHWLLPVAARMPRSTHEDDPSPRQAAEGLA